MDKVCGKCLVTKPASEYYALPHTGDGLNWQCTPCQNAYNRAYNRQRTISKLDPVVLARFSPNATDETRLFRFARKVARHADGCWHWTGNRHPDCGYPRIWFARHDDRMAHRVGYEFAIGPIPDKLTLDHLCRVRHCVNPDHLEPVTRGENTLRGDSPWSINKRKTHCINGHEFTPDNTWTSKRGERHCRECTRIRKRQRRARLSHAPNTSASTEGHSSRH